MSASTTIERTDLLSGSMTLKQVRNYFRISQPTTALIIKRSQSVISRHDDKLVRLDDLVAIAEHCGYAVTISLVKVVQA